MTETDKSIQLVAGFMFTAQACRVLQLKTINRFDINTGKWKSSNFNPKKYRNFHDCELFLAKGEFKLVDDRNGDLMEYASGNVLNASLVVVKIEDEYACLECDVTQQDGPVPLSRTNIVESNPHTFDIFVIAVPPGESYTDLERMFMMFSFELWIAITVTLLIGLLVTLSLNFVSDQTRTFIAGRGIQSPTMNFVSIFSTGGQVRTPGRNFARFIFILFVMWSLIIRTCHQSMLFELLQADLRRPAIKTMDELFGSNMTMRLSEFCHDGDVLSDEYFWERMAQPSTT